MLVCRMAISKLAPWGKVTSTKLLSATAIAPVTGTREGEESGEEEILAITPRLSLCPLLMFCFVSFHLTLQRIRVTLLLSFLFSAIP